METVLENIDKVSGKSLKTKLTDNKESALLSKQLATICTEAPVDTAVQNYELQPMKEEARTLLRIWSFAICTSALPRYLAVRRTALTFSEKLLSRKVVAGGSKYAAAGRGAFWCIG